MRGNPPKVSKETEKKAKKIKTTSVQRKNLVDLAKRTPEERKEIARKGGIKSGEVKREQILMSKIFADYLIEEHDVMLRDDQGNVIDKEKITAKELIRRTITGIMTREDSASVSMMKTITEATEGQNVKLTGADGGAVEVTVIKRVIVDNKGKTN